MVVCGTTLSILMARVEIVTLPFRSMARAVTCVTPSVETTIGAV